MTIEQFIMGNWPLDIWQVLIRVLGSVIIGAIIGTERALHGRAAGMRTHILVCIGACLTSMTGLFVSQILGRQSDVLRIAAQVISGVGFLGAGMIIIKNNNVIAGLTTAAGVWTTGIIGVAMGFGFYFGAVVVTIVFMIAIVFFSRFERRKKMTQVIYIEIDDMHSANATIDTMKTFLNTHFTCQFSAPKSEFPGHLGVIIVIEKRIPLDIHALCKLDHVVFVQED